MIFNVLLYICLDFLCAMIFCFFFLIHYYFYYYFYMEIEINMLVVGFGEDDIYGKWSTDTSQNSMHDDDDYYY